MNFNAKYDVFISYSRKDYVDEAGNPIPGNAISEMLEFLDRNGISYWFDKDGISGGSEFLEVITDAITDSKMMIFVSSKHSNASLWTKGEIFEALDQKMLIVPFKIDRSQYNKKYRLMMNFLDFIEYYANPETAFDSLFKAINLGKEEYEQAVAEEARREAEEKERQRKEQLLKEIEADCVEYQRHASVLKGDAQKIVEKQKLVGNKEKKCPVCSTLQAIERSYCKKCGWNFNPIFDANPSGDNSHLFIMRSLWQVVQEANVVRVQHETKARELEERLKEKTLELESISKENIDKLKSLVGEKDKEIATLQNRLEESKEEFKQISLELSNYKVRDEQLQLALEDAERIGREKQEKEDSERKAREAKTTCNDETAKGYCEFEVRNVKFKMIRVKGGSFVMGATHEMSNPWESELPTHNVTLDSYYMGETQVTQELWEAIMGSNPSFMKGESLPVERVSWDDCQVFINKLNLATGKKFRLPTEAEWEYAARGGACSCQTQYSGSDKLRDVAWFDGNSGSTTHSVKTVDCNELGLYDMTGNVWEWCQDWYGNYSEESLTNPQGPAEGIYRVDRGGSIYNDAKGCRISHRGASSPSYRGEDLGLRLALSE